MVVEAEFELCRGINRRSEARRLGNRVEELLCVVNLVRGFFLVNRDVVDLFRAICEDSVESFTRNDVGEANLPRLGDDSELTLVVQEPNLIRLQLRRGSLRLRQEFQE